METKSKNSLIIWLVVSVILVIFGTAVVLKFKVVPMYHTYTVEENGQQIKKRTDFKLDNPFIPWKPENNK